LHKLTEIFFLLSHAPIEAKELTQTFDMMLSRLADACEQQRQFVGNAYSDFIKYFDQDLGIDQFANILASFWHNI
jgi:hypothetical protein